MKKMIERQVIVTWYTPEEKLPEEGVITVASVSGMSKDKTIYDHAFVLVEWYEKSGDDEAGWVLTDNDDLDMFTVHAWCDLEPYGGGK